MKFHWWGGRINQYKFSFYPDALQSWNSLDPVIRQAVSLSKFKADVQSLIRYPKKSFFNTHDPIGLKRLFQLRVQLSPLKHHKKRKGFIDTPSDICSCQLSAETTEHFLIHCGLYIVARHTLFQVINPILAVNGLYLHNELLVNFLLYGNEALSFDENKAALTATMKFIQNSTRFDKKNEWYVVGTLFSGLVIPRTPPPAPDPWCCAPLWAINISSQWFESLCCVL